MSIPWTRLSLALDGAFVGAVCALALLALTPFNSQAPFEGRVAVSVFVLLLGCLVIGILRALLMPHPIQRACAVAAGLGVVYLSLLLDSWARSSPARAASALAQGLSATRFELPWVALLVAMSLGGLVVLQFFALRRLLLGWTEHATRLLSLSVVLACAGLLLRALIAYSSGSASLFVTSVG
jgi:hypothetical protein